MTLEELEAQTRDGLKEFGEANGPATRRVATQADLDKLTQETLSQFGPTTKLREGATSQSSPKDESGWSAPANVMQGLTLGGYPAILAAGGKGKGTTFSERYEDIDRARSEWVKKNPLMALTTEMGGALPTTLATMGVGELAAGATVGRLLPQAAKSFLSGTAGGEMTGLGGVLTRLGSTGTRGAIEGAATGALQSGMSDESMLDQAKTGGIVGAPFGWAGGVVKKALGPNMTDAVARTAREGLEEGVPLRLGQVPGGGRAASILDFLYNAKKNPEQLAAAHEVLAQSAGMPKMRNISQKAVDAHEDKLGKVFDYFTQNRTLDLRNDATFQKEWAALDAKANAQMSTEGYEKFRDLAKKVEKDWKQGTIPGSVYQAWTQRGGLIDNFTGGKNKGNEVGHFARDLRNVVDDAWERALAQHSPTDAAVWKEAKRQWKNTKIIDDGINTATDSFDLTKLLSSVERAYGDSTKASAATPAGMADLGALARAGTFMAKPEPTGLKAHGPAALRVAGATSLGVPATVMAHDFLPNIVPHIPLGEAAAGPLAYLGLAYGGSRAVNSVMNSPKMLDRITARQLGVDPLYAINRFLPPLPANPLTVGLTPLWTGTAGGGK